jgi:hypothetical protein
VEKGAQDQEEKSIRKKRLSSRIVLGIENGIRRKIPRNSSGFQVKRHRYDFPDYSAFNPRLFVAGIVLQNISTCSTVDRMIHQYELPMFPRFRPIIAH